MKKVNETTNSDELLKNNELPNVRELSNKNEKNTISLLDQVKNSVKNSKKESITSKIKELYLKKIEHEKSVKLLDIEINNIISDFENGLT